MMMTRLIAAMGILAGAVLAQDTLSLQISGFPSCSVQAWSFGATGGSAATTGTAAGATKSQVSNLIMTRVLDNCSVNLFKAAVMQTPLSTVVLKILKPTGTANLPVFTMTLENVVVSNYQLNGTASNSVPTESVAFSFTKINIETTSVNPTNGSTSSVVFGWDLLANRAD